MPDDGHGRDRLRVQVDDATGEWSHWGALIPVGVGPGGLSPSSSPRCSCRRSTRRAASSRSASPSARAGRAASSAARARPRRRRCCSSSQEIDEVTRCSRRISFSSATTPASSSGRSRSSVEKRQGKTFGPPGNKKMLVFIDDISMPAVNEWGDQITLEIVRQLMEYGGLLQPRQAGRVQVHQGPADCSAACCTPGGGKNDISCMPGRWGPLKRHFHIMNVTLPSVASINQIFGSLLNAHSPPRRSAGPRGVGRLALLVAMTIRLWEDQEEDAADARQVPLHLQPARPLARLPGRLHVRRWRGAEIGRPAARPVEARVRARLRRPARRLRPTRRGSQDDRQAHRGPVRGQKGAAAQGAACTLSTSCATAATTPRRARSCRAPQVYEPVAALPECRERVGLLRRPLQRGLQAQRRRPRALRRRAAPLHAHLPHHAHAARLGAARRRRRLGQADAHAARRVRGGLALSSRSPSPSSTTRKT